MQASYLARYFTFLLVFGTLLIQNYKVFGLEETFKHLGHFNANRTPQLLTLTENSKTS